jgi:pimeloyl-ACP methyl ester carboxylesterase
MLETRSVNIAGHRLGVVVGNEHVTGTPVIFLHGILGSVNFWPPLLPPSMYLNRRWYSVSLPGHFPALFPRNPRPEDTMPDHLTDLLGETIRHLVGNEAVGLVGWSTGACLALLLAARRPWQVRSVLSLSGFARGRWHGVLGLLQKLARRNALGRFAFRSSLRTMTAHDTLFRWSYGLAAARARSLWSSPTGRRVLAAIRPDAARHDLSAIQLLFARIHTWDVTDRLRTMRVPVIIAGGDRDPIIPYEHTRTLADLVPGARLVTFAGTGHTFFAECPEEFHACLQTWLDELGPPGRSGNASGWQDRQTA